MLVRKTYYPQIRTSIESIAVLIPWHMNIFCIQRRRAVITEFSTFFSYNYTFTLWRAWVVSLLDCDCTMNWADVQIISTSWLQRLECVKVQSTAERSGILAYQWCAEFFHSCQLAAVCALCRSGYWKQKSWYITWNRCEHSSAD